MMKMKGFSMSRSLNSSLVVFFSILVGSFSITQVIASDDDQATLEQAKALFKPLPESAALENNALTHLRVALGKALFYETRLSSDGRQGCVSCHNPAYYGADSLPLSMGIHGKVLPRNAPTVFNTALLVAQHYGGNRASVEEQAVKALTSPVAYGNATYEQAENKLKLLGYQPLFDKAFAGEAKTLSAENWGKAIGAFERTLLTPAPFDRYLKGDSQALSAQAKRGLKTFIDTGCAGCHNGVTIGGQIFQKFGITQDYWLVTGSTEKEAFKGYDKGRYHDTKNEADAFMFKVPQLRNVAMTPPYFHDGSAATLPQAVRIMAQLQLGKKLSDNQVSDIVSFLEALTGSIPADFAQAPQLPVASH
jgi:cytochrome c peroxidase